MGDAILNVPSHPPCARPILFPFLLLFLTGITLSAADFGPDKPLYEALGNKQPKDFTIECWFKPDASCPDGACVFDKLIGSDRSAVRLEIHGATLRLVNTGGDATEAPLPTDGAKVHVVAVVDRSNKKQTLYVDAAPPVSTPFSYAIAASKEEGPLRIGGDLAGGHRFSGTVFQVIYHSYPFKDSNVKPDFTVSPADAAKLGWGQIGRWDLTGAPGADGGYASPPNPGQNGAPGVPGPEMVAARVLPPDPAPENNTTLWYGHPAWDWLQAVPVGNGRLAGMVFGGIDSEQIELNEGTVWAGGPNDPVNPASTEAMKQIRALLLQGKSKEASDLWKASAMAIPLHQPAYQELGNLALSFALPSGAAEKYRRTLDLDAAVARTRYTINGVTYTRETFSSAPDRVLVTRITADRPGSISFTAALSTVQKAAQVSADGNVLAMDGTSGDWDNGQDGQPIKGQIHFAVRLAAKADGGAVSVTNDGIKVDKADSVTLLLAAATNYVSWKDLSADGAAIAKSQLAAAEAKPYADLLAAHEADYRKLFRRVAIDLGSGTASGLPTDERVRRFTEGNDPALAALLYQYGRYLLIAGSRPGGQPETLQGLWAVGLNPPWGSRYTVNINTQMNYWPSETTNLSECSDPLFAMTDDLSESGVKSAKVMYGADGWTCHHNTNLWRDTAPIDGGAGMWPMAGAWLCTHLWQHYLFTGDKEFLKKQYPVMRGAAVFLNDILIEEPTHHWLVVDPSFSPENGSLTVGTTIDQSITRDAFDQVIAASKVLGVDADLRDKLQASRDKLAPLQIGKLGQLQEWLQDLDSPNDHNRHASHLYTVFPSAQVTPDTPDLFKAAQQSLKLRGDGATGWSLAWKINFWARFQDGDHAYLILSNLLGEPGHRDPEKGDGGGLFPNLFDAHPPFQIDGNFGFTSGVTEMLLQSQLVDAQGNPKLLLLPALPKVWATGSVSGLRARGGFEVDLKWANGALSGADVRSTWGTACTVSYNGKEIPVRLAAGGATHLDFK